MNNNIWKFKVFVSINNVCDFEKWFDSQIPEDRAKIKIFIDRLLIAESWSPKHVRPLSGYSKINELVIKGKKIQLRPLGCFGPTRKDFTLLLGAIEKNDHFIPKDAPKKAETRYKLVLSDGERYTRDYE
jgi:hypothetical protein